MHFRWLQVIVIMLLASGANAVQLEGSAGNAEGAAFRSDPSIPATGSQPLPVGKTEHEYELSESAFEGKLRASWGLSFPSTKKYIEISAPINQRETFAPAKAISFLAGVGNGNQEGPADPAIAAGPNDLIAATNAGFQIFNKSGTLILSGTLNHLLNLPDPPFRDEMFDPKLAFDPYSQKFWFVATTYNGSYFVAGSIGNSAAGGWIWRELRTTYGGLETGTFCDYPQLGFDTQALYISCNMRFGNFFDGSYANLRIFDKSQFEQPVFLWWDLRNWTEGNIGTTPLMLLQPARMYGASITEGEYVISAHGRGGFGNALQVARITNPTICCVLGSQRAPRVEITTVTVGSFDTPPKGIQPQGNITLDTVETRLQFAIWQNGALATGHNIACQLYACIAFTELGTNTFPSLQLLNDWHIGSAGYSYFFPGVAADNSGNRTMLFGASGSDLFSSVAAVGIPSAGLCTECISTLPSILEYGVASYAGVPFSPPNNYRWGDYFSASPDPDGKRIWVHGTLATGPTQWRTLIAATLPDLPPPPMIAVASSQSVTDSSAILHSQINSGNLGGSAWFEWGTDPQLTSAIETVHTNVEKNATAFELNAPLVGLKSITKYYFRALASNVFGTNKSTTLSFTTQAPPPNISLNVTALTLPTTVIDEASSTLQVVITSTGGSPLNLLAIGSDSEFPFTSNCPTSLAVGTSCNVSIRFQPSSAGLHVGTLSLVTNLSSPLVKIALTAQAISKLSIVPPLINISAVVGHSFIQDVTLRNNSAISPLTWSLFSYPQWLSISTDCGSVLPKSAACSMRLTFNASSTMPKSGLIMVSNDSGSSSQSIAVTAVGVDFILGLIRPHRPSRNGNLVIAGQTTSYLVSVGSTASSAQSIAHLRCSGAPVDVTCSVSPNELDLSDGGAKTATIFVNAASDSKALRLRGSGLQSKQRRTAFDLSVDATVGGITKHLIIPITIAQH